MKDQFEISQNEKLRKDIKRLKEAARQSQIWSDKHELDERIEKGITNE